MILGIIIIVIVIILVVWGIGAYNGFIRKKNQNRRSVCYDGCLS